MRPSGLVSKLEALRGRFDETSGDDKCALISKIRKTKFETGEQLQRVHDALLFVRAYADNDEVVKACEGVLGAFAARRDLRALREELEDTGIAGTTIYYRFWLTTARWLSTNWPGQLHIDWPEFENAEQLEDMLWMLVHYSEGPAIEVYGESIKQWVQELKRDGETDAEFLSARLAALDAGPFVREAIYDKLELPYRLAPGQTTPCRTLARVPQAPVVYQQQPLDTSRPDLAKELKRPPLSVTEVKGVAAKRLVNLAKGAMVTRSRDLNSFMYADPHDVRLIDCGDGLSFIALGLIPEQRGLLEGIYAFITIQNGVPMGYVLSSGLFGVAEVAYNVFPTFRGGEAAKVYGRALAMIHHLLGATVFAVDPYQLGHGNEEGLSSGAWWFYHKLGFRPRDPGVKRLLKRELATMKKNRKHRSSRDTLMELSSTPMYLLAKAQPDDAVDRVDGIGLAASRYLSSRFGSEREKGAAVCAREAAVLLGCPGWVRWKAGEKLAFRRWAPVVCAMPGLTRWSPKARREMADVIRAKGGPRESEFVRKFDQHKQLRRTLLRMSDQAG